jgi:cation:H+ antiporter
MIIGITIVGFGTSAPEIVVSILAVQQGTPDLAIGNALGSNIANIGLILGITAILVPVPVVTRLFKTEYPLLLLATAVMTWALFDLNLGLVDGCALLGLLLLCMYHLVGEHRRHPAAYAQEEHENEELVPDLTMAAAIGWTIFGLVLLVASSKLLVWGASSIALVLGISELIIGLTIVALGTGNVIGSNLFNSLAVVGLPAIFIDFDIDPSARSRDLPVVILLTLALVLMSRFPGLVPRFLTRIKGIFLFSAFVIYQLYLYYEVAVG